MQNKFATYTQSIINKLPYWFSMKKNKEDSIGAMFLNCFGLELDEVRFLIDYAYNQVYIDYTDINQIDILYKAELPDFMLVDNITSVNHSEAILKITKTLPDFYSLKDISVNNEWIYDSSHCFLDKGRKIIYVHKDYDKDNDSKYGKITVRYNNENYTFKLQPHHVWNFLDEFGMLLGCKRLFCEKNYSYKERILDVFKNKANASKIGVLNGIARELSLRKNIVWEDSSKDIVLKDKMIVLNKIKIDEEFTSLKDVFLNKCNQVVIKGKQEDKNKVKKISYVQGVEIHELFNKNNIKLQNDLYDAKGNPRKTLLDYSDYIKKISSCFWGDFMWGETYWDMNKSEKGGMAYIPNFKDAKIGGFKNFG